MPGQQWVGNYLDTVDIEESGSFPFLLLKVGRREFLKFVQKLTLGVDLDGVCAELYVDVGVCIRGFLT